MEFHLFSETAMFRRYVSVVSYSATHCAIFMSLACYFSSLLLFRLVARSVG